MKSNSTSIAEEKKDTTTTPHTPNSEVTEITSEELAKFYYMGKRPGGIPEELDLEITRPMGEGLLQEYPIVLPENTGENPGQSLFKLLETAIKPHNEGLERGSPREALYHNLQYWVQLYGEHSNKSYVSTWGPENHQILAEAFLNSFEASEETKESLELELKSLISSLPDASKILPFNENIHLQSGLHFLQNEKMLAKQSRLKALKELISRLKDLIEVHQSHSSRALPKTGESNPFGEIKSINLEKLSKTIPKYKGAKLISQSRLEAMRNALNGLQSSLETLLDSPLLVVFSSSVPKSIVSDPKYIQWENSNTPLKAAVGFVKQLAQRGVETLRAIKLAQIETEGMYREDIHPAYLDSLKWDFSNMEAMDLLPEIVIYDKFKDPESLEKLTAEYPFKILMDYSLDQLIQKTESGFKSHNITFSLKQMFGLKCFVSHINTSSSSQLLDSLSQFAKYPGLAISMACVSQKTEATDFEYYKIYLALKSRLTPYLKYSPTGAKRISQSFSIDSNPCVDEDWISEDEESITPAHLMLIMEKWESEFLCLDRVDVPDLLSNLTDYLEKEPLSSAEFFPVINAGKSEGSTSKYVLSKAIVSYCADILLQWRELQELGGIHNYHAEKAKAEISKELTAKHVEELEALKAAYNKELEEAKRTEATQALSRLAEGLLNLKWGDLSSGNPTDVAVKTAESVSAKTEEAVFAEKEAGEAALPQNQEESKNSALEMEAYIDSELCTSCNDCINVNNRLFKYNGDKQAEIADVAQGTFAELVKAALKCPAKCIHPGTPRPGDATATAELITQAETLN